MVSNTTFRCPYCGTEQLSNYVICSNPECQRERPPSAPLPTPYPNPAPVYVPPRPVGADKKIPAGICGILLGWLGVHKFILGYTKEGIIMLAVSLVVILASCGTLVFIPLVFGIVEGIVYLTKSDEEFVRTYIENKRGWF